MPSGVNYHYTNVENESYGFVCNSQPFFPEFSIDTGADDSYFVKFNEGYIFDYANGGDRKRVKEDEEFTITEEEKKTYYLELTLDDADGSVSEAIIKSKETAEGGEGGEEDSDFVNLKNLSDIEGPYAGEDKKIKIDIVELQGPSIDKIYVRENIHLWFRGFQQRGGAGHAPLKSTPSEGANDFVEFRELIPDADEENILTMSTVGDSITFFVPKPDDSSGTEVVVESDTSAGKEDNIIEVTSTTGSNGTVTYSLYVPPCSCESITSG